MKKMVLKLSIQDEKSKRNALKVAAGVQGVDSVSVDMKEKKITVIGEVDPVYLTSKLRKFGSTELLSVGPAKEEQKEGEKKDAKKEEKKPEAKKEEKKPEAKKEGGKKDAKKEEKKPEAKKEGEKKDVKKEEKKPEAKKEGEKDVKKEEKTPESPTVVYPPGNYNYMPYEYSVLSEEDPNACAIC